MFSKVFEGIDYTERPKGLTAEEIELLSSQCHAMFGCELPDGYKLFLREANGLCDDGYSVYCYFNSEMQRDFPFYSDLDFISFNERFVKNTDIVDYLILGKSSVDYLAYHKKEKEYVIMTNGIMMTIHKDHKFETILKKFFRV